MIKRISFCRTYAFGLLETKRHGLNLWLVTKINILFDWDSISIFKNYEIIKKFYCVGEMMPI